MLGGLRVKLAEQRRRAKINDLWIAAVAQANGMAVVTGMTISIRSRLWVGRWLSGVARRRTRRQLSRNLLRGGVTSGGLGGARCGRGTWGFRTGGCRWRGGWRWPAQGLPG